MLDGVLLLGLDCGDAEVDDCGTFAPLAWCATIIRCGGLVDCGEVCGGGVGVWSGAVPGGALGGGTFGCSVIGAL